MASSSSHHRRQAHEGDDSDALEEGEFFPGSDYSSASDDTKDDSDRYSLQSRPREKEEEIHTPLQLSRRLEEILSIGRATTLPSYFWESDGTISDDDPDAFSAGTVYSCHVCGKGFGSPKAVGGHMRVHDPRGPHGYVAITADWAAMGKRGCTGAGSNKGKAAAVSSSDELNHSPSMATSSSSSSSVVSAAGPSLPFQPLPLAFARSNLSSSLSMASARTTINLESGETSSPHSIHNNPMAPAAAAAAGAEAQQQGQQQVVLQLAPAAPPPAPRRQYTCKLCGKSYPTHQGLGGHAAGHKNRRKEEAADGGVVPGVARGGARKKAHKCDQCDKVFPSGVALGGHKRMHYKGPPIVHRKTSKKQCVETPAAPSPAAGCREHDGLTLALGIRAGQPPAPSRLRLFGIDIGPPPAEAPQWCRRARIDTIRPQEEAPEVQQGTDTTPHAEAARGEGEGSSSDMTTEGSASAGGQRKETVERSSTDSPSKESSN